MKYFVRKAAVLTVLTALMIMSGCPNTISVTEKKDTTAPKEVTAFKTVAGNGKISLSWTNPADEDLYQVELSVSPAAGSLASPVYLAAEKGKAMSFTAEGLTNGTGYTFTVKTIDKALNKSSGVSTKEAVKPIDTSDKTAPSEVTDLKAVAGNGKISLSWTNPADEDLYQVEITASPAAGTLTNPVYLAAQKGASGGFIAEGLANDTEYTFTVKTIDKSLNTGKAVTVKATPKSSGAGGTVDTTAPAEVTELKAVAGNGKISLSWKNPADEDLYQVEITVSPAAGSLTNPVYLAAQKGAAGGFIAEGLANDTEYTFTVKTIDRVLNKSTGVTTEKVQTLPAGSPMTLSLSQSPEKTVWTKDTVSITVTSSTSIKTAKWIKGVKTLKEIFASGTEISGTNFTVAENGIYSVAVQDNEGRREVETINITNIDKIPPLPVQNLKAAYNSGTQKITVTWDVLSDTGLKGYLVSYKKGGTAVVTEQEQTGTSFSIDTVAADGTEYELSIKAIDKVGNKGEEAVISVTASAAPSLSKITLTRKHLAYNDTDRTISVTLEGSNFNLIASQADSTVKAGIYDEGGTLQGSLVTITSIDTINNEATVDLTAPILSSGNASYEGKRYTVKVKLCGDYSAVTESFVITKEARLTKNPELSLKTIASNEVTGETKTTITVTGANLATAGGIKIRLYNSEGVVEGGEIAIDASSQAAGTVSSFTADIPIPQKEGVFTAKVFFGSMAQTKIYSHPSNNYGANITNPTIQVYGVPTFTTFTIPKVGIKEDVTLIARVRGANFKAPGVTESNFTVSCTEKPSITNGSTVTVLSDAALSVALKIPGQAGSYTVKITSGGQSLEGTFIVKDYSAYTVGKIVLKDGTLVAKDDYAAIESSNPPVAVITGVNDYGRAIGIGLHVSQSSLMWAKSGTAGYNTKFEGIVCTPSASGSGGAEAATFTGDLDGSDNWEYICSIDPEGSANAEMNYPAFHWVNQYNTTYADVLAGADIKWYMPSLAELCAVYKNKDAINESLARIHGMPNGADYADQSLGTSYYWSSSQYASYYYFAWQVLFDGGYVDYSYKTSNSRVCCLSGF